ncbi:phosphoadenosine phosphosulfate reductase family protein [uncultured Pseudodesulfovibrio sp.]|uniref:phosphoadenosine phosphosulfate reductase family protein n=1 Tax=uncultured Pseudodesulfovibrio sp. TaxID=2035858 RepID=UPI0029C60F1A|nr:phosphoadenosine phosphosulfate reductase family protein [uncultured Pseudodesulfovibrio sp.]
MPSASLDEKINCTETELTGLLDTASSDAVRVAWTGGKDSTVVLFIWKALLDHHGLGPVRAINLDTGCKFPEVLAFRDRLTREWGVDLHVARPGVELAGYPVAQDVMTCCHDLKVKPLKAAIRETGATHLLTGIRHDEHPDRAGREVREQRDDPPHILLNPLLDWTETDIWAFHARFNLPHCELYDQGYRSLGCVPCTSKSGVGNGERSGRDQSKESVLESLTSLGYF